MSFETLHTLFRLLKAGRPTVGPQRWSEFVPPEFNFLSEGGPNPQDVYVFKNWLRSYARWRTSYEAFAANEHAELAQDETDQRHREFFAALYLKSAQWHAILLMLIKNVPEPERAKYLGELDGSLAGLRQRFASPGSVLTAGPTANQKSL